MVPELSAVCGEAVAGIAHDADAMRAALSEFTREDCSRANILGAAGLVSWSIAWLQGAGPEAEPVIAELQGRVGLLFLVACYSGGRPHRTLQQRHDRLYFKAEICLERAARAENAGHLDVAELLCTRACELRAQAIALRYS